MNSLYVRRRLKVMVPTPGGRTPQNVITALQKNITSLGFVLSPDVCDRLRQIPAEKMEPFYKELVAGLREKVGAHQDFRPMYPDFPRQVMEMGEARLYWNAIFHYCTNLLLPFEKRERTPLLEQSALKVVGLGDRDDFEGIFSLLVSSGTSISAEDKGDVRWFVSQYRDKIARLIPESIPCRENLAVLAAALLRDTRFGEAWLSKHITTATDILRVAVALSDGDVSLAESAKFGKFTRGERRLFLSLLEECPHQTEDMLRWKGRWIRLGERLHPGDYRKEFPKSCAAFDVLRNDTPFESFNGAIERLLASGDSVSAANQLKTRPGELTRRLDHLLRTGKEQDAVVSSFRECAQKVATPLLLQVAAHFAARIQPADLRVFFPKGEVAKATAILNELPGLSPDICRIICGISEETLTTRFAKLAPLGNCFLDERLKTFPVPFSQRSASKALRTLSRGSCLPLPDCRVLRFFIWWRNGKSRTDIDLSAALYDGSCRYMDVLSYYNLKNFGGCHSGDIVDAPNGAAEFIDLDVEQMRKLGVRYIVMSLNSFTMQPYCDLPECFAGWMARREPNSGEIFEPRTVQDKVDIAANTKVSLPAIFDLEENQVIWADLALKGSPRWNNVANNLSGVSLMLRAMTSLQKPTLHNLFSLHIKARGQAVDTVAAADTVFSLSEGITPFDIDRIGAGFL